MWIISNRVLLLLFSSMALWLVLGSSLRGQEVPRVLTRLDVAKVWSGHPVGFCLLTRGNRQYVGYYDEARRLTVAMRTLDSTEWITKELPEAVGWDSHNYITMAIDERGHVHLAGNMHNDPLVYFRTTGPFDISSFAQADRMVGTEETPPSSFGGNRAEPASAIR